MPPARRKRRSVPQINEERSKEVLRCVLPPQWVIHDYAPDYGIDGVVELFEYVDSEQQMAETLGESFFFQLKSVETSPLQTRRVRNRLNVEKFPLSAEPRSAETADLEVMAYPLETDELLTIESMGSGLAVLLLLVTLDTGSVSFVCLTDYIDKVLTPEDRAWREKGTKTIYVPVVNRIEPDTTLLLLLRFYALRPKLMGMFTKVHFQWAELEHGLMELGLDGWRWMAVHFADRLLQLDVWEFPGWPLLGWYRAQLVQVRRLLESSHFEEGSVGEVIAFWYRMDAISRTFEDVMREGALPTLLGPQIA